MSDIRIYYFFLLFSPLYFSNCLTSIDPSNNDESEKLFARALELDPSNETVLTMFAIFKCNRYILNENYLFDFMFFF